MSGTMLVTIGLLGIIIACIMTAFFDFRGLETTVGIDLGTTYSVIACNRGGGDGVVVIPNSRGNNLTPSVVSYLPNGDVLVGEDALRMATKMPKSTIYESKRFLGHKFGDIGVAEDITSHPFQVTKDPVTDEVMFKLVFEDNNTDNIQTVKFVSPIEIGTMIIRDMRKSINTFLGHGNVQVAVIAVPAEFNTAQRIATRTAFERAGFTVMRVLDEPQAAAIAYGFQKRDDIHYVIVYDFGGGTLDVSLLYVSEGSVQVIGTAGDNHLGGSDFDSVFASYLYSRIQSDQEEEDDGEIDDSCSLPSLRLKAEKAKCQFSTMESVKITCIHSKSGENVQFSVTKSEFEQATVKLFERALEPIKIVLEECGSDVEEIDEVVLVGGSTRLTRIRDMISHYFNGKKLNHSIDPDVTVAMGAASTY